MKKIIITIGHSIVRSSEGSWSPSEIYQEVEFSRGTLSRTFQAQDFCDPDSPNAYLGGGKVVVNALFEAWKRCPSADVAFVGGRPHHMDRIFKDEVSHLSEASVMAEYFESFVNARRPKTLLVEGTRNTEDDVREVLQLASDYDQATLILMSFRIFRAKLLMEEFVKNNPHVAEAAAKVVFCNAEQFLPQLFDDFVRMNQSGAYVKTMKQERSGVLAMLNGSGSDYVRTG